MKKAYLVLSSGQIFEGERIGAETDFTGELVFCTNVVGYLEALTDPAYAGQILVQTFPLIGNYGVIPEDLQGKAWIGGYVCRECCAEPSNFRSEYELDRYLKENGIPGICNVDTRQLTRIIRDGGLIKARICGEKTEEFEKIAAAQPTGLVKTVSTKEVREFPAKGEEKAHAALIDYGTKLGVIEALCARGCRVTVLPQDVTAQQVLDLKPDGLFLSEGPGDPAENADCVEQLKQLIGKLPVFGMGLGHQLAALAMGGKTCRLPYGHRGSNQPVKDAKGVRTLITAQNHGYAVDAESLKDKAVVTYFNANDGSCEGLEYPEKDCFTVQFDVTARETVFLTERFIARMGGNQNA